eukprot:EG_transcript_19680
MIHAPTVFRTKAADSPPPRSLTRPTTSPPALPQLFPCNPPPYKSFTPAFTFCNSKKGKTFPDYLVPEDYAAGRPPQPCACADAPIDPGPPAPLLYKKAFRISTSKREELFDLRQQRDIPGPGAYAPEERLVRPKTVGGALTRSRREGPFDDPPPDIADAALRCPDVGLVKPRPPSPSIGRAAYDRLGWAATGDHTSELLYSPDLSPTRPRTIGGAVPSGPRQWLTPYQQEQLVRLDSPSKRRKRRGAA